MEKRELDALLYVSSWCLVIVVCLLLTMPRVCLQFVIVVFPVFFVNVNGIEKMHEKIPS